MISRMTVLSKMFSELKDFPLVRLFYNIKGTNKLFILCTINNVDTQMNTRIFVNKLEDKYKIKLDCKYIKEEGIPKVLKELEEYDKDIITFGNYIRLEEIYIDKDIRIPILQLNDAGFRTRFSCSGHGNLKHAYVMFEFDGIASHVVAIARTGIFDVTLSNNLLEDNLKVILKIKCASDLKNAQIDIKELMNGLVDLLVFNNKTALEDINTRCMISRQDTLDKLKEDRKRNLDLYLEHKIKLED